jgi:hypothetical protein
METILALLMYVLALFNSNGNTGKVNNSQNSSSSSIISEEGGIGKTKP